MNQKQTVFIVEDDDGARGLICAVVDSMGQVYKEYSSATDFLNDFDATQSGCLILDVCMESMNGLELQKQLIKRGSSLPIIFCSGFGNISMAVKTMQLGAVDFIEKPFVSQQLTESIIRALKVDMENRVSQQHQQNIESKLASFSTREKEVFLGVVAGKMNKEIAFELGISERTVEVHRSQVMKKSDASTLAQLVRLKVESE